MTRSEVKDGDHFYVSTDPRSLAIAVATCDATEIMGNWIGRRDVVFHLDRESGKIEYMKPDATVYPADNLDK